MYNYLALIALFIAGFFAGKLQSDNSWHKELEENQRQYTLQLIQKQKQNESVIESYTNLKNDYSIVVKEKLDVIQRNKELINNNNIITHRFVQYTSIKPTTNMQTNNTESIINPDDRISAVQYGEWIIGLQQHDNSCLAQLNALISIINN